MLKTIITYFQTKRRMKFTREQLELYQERRLERLYKKVKKNSPYYQKYDPETQPVVDKNWMLENFDELNTAGLKLDEVRELAISSEQTRNFSTTIGEYSVGLSSGTSGHQGVFVLSQEERESWLGAILAKLLKVQDLIRKQSIAFFLRANNELYETASSRRFEFEFYDLEDPVNELFERLKQQNPTILIGQSSLLLQIAKRKHDGDLSNIERVVNVAEVLEDEDAIYLVEVFGVKHIDQVYQATEGLLGTTCSHGSIHLHEDIVYFEKEWIDDKRFFPIITDLYRYTQPYINYRLNDILQVHEEQNCPCGQPNLRLSHIEGREDDTFSYLNSDEPIFPDFIRRAVLFVDGVQEYQVSQDEDKNIYIELLVQDKYDLHTVFEEIKTELLKFDDFNITLKEYTYPKSGKLKRVRRI